MTQPKHTFVSVVEELVEGLETGAIRLEKDSSEPVGVPVPSPDVPPVSDGRSRTKNPQPQDQ